MKIRKIQIQQFKSFIEPIMFDLEMDNGLYFVTGENRVEPDLGANGAGKSALWEALCWGLYGKTSTNLKASNIVSWGFKSAMVEVYIDDFVIARCQNPNWVKIGEEIVEQEDVVKKLGFLGFESFLYSTFISQFSAKFFDLSPADKMFVFSDIMAEVLQPWMERSDRAKMLSLKLNEKIDTNTLTLSNLEGQLEQLKKTDYSQAIKDFDQKKNKDIDSAKQLLKETENKFRRFEKEMKERVKERVQKALYLKKNKPKDYSDEIRRIKEAFNDYTKKKNMANANYLQYKSQLEKLEGVSGESICPLCRQKVDKKHLKSEITDMKVLISEAVEEYESNKKQASQCSEKLDEINKIVKKEENQYAELSSVVKELDFQTYHLADRLKEERENIKKAQEIILATEERVNVFLDLEQKRILHIQKINKELDELVSNTDKLVKERDAYQYWVKGFKEIRLLLMVDALKEFEVSINNNLNKMGLGDWNVLLDIDQENKSGTIRKGFSVLVESPNHSGPVPFECWSGGEGQRLRLAGTIGLMDLIQSKRQLDFGMEIFDEPTQFLSEHGIDDLLQVLYYWAKEKETKIFITDHRNFQTFGGFHGIIQIIKDEKGSRIE